MSKDIILKEKFEGGLKHALYSNFSRYSDAILELVDNSVSNRILGKLLTINILTSKNKLTIIDKGGRGMDINGLQEFLEWGKIKPRNPYDIGAYSQGGKAAMGYLGRGMVVITSSHGGWVQYRIEDNDLHQYNLKNYRVTQIPTDEIRGFTQIEVEGLRRAINEENLKSVLADTYRPLIEKNEIVIKYNGELIKIKSFPLDEDFNVENFSFSIKIDSDTRAVNGWIGRLASKSGIKGGMRCYKLGRLICDREFFGPYDANYKQTLNFLFGETYLDFVPVTTNKTDFDRDSYEWKKMQEKIFEILKPHIDELLGREIKEPSDEEKVRVREARDLVAELMKMRNKELKGVASIEGEAFGQKPPESKEGKVEVSEAVFSRGKYKPRTSPPKGAKGKRRRLKEFMEWDIRPMEESTRSIIEEIDGKKTLVINNLFPGFKAAKGHILYLIETAALQLAQPDKDEKLTPREYLVDFDELYSYFCNNLDLAKEKIKKKRQKQK